MQFRVKEYYNNFSSHLTRPSKDWPSAIQSAVNEAVRFARINNDIRYIHIESYTSGKVTFKKEE